jgi:hypothetical protein
MFQAGSGYVVMFTLVISALAQNTRRSVHIDNMGVMVFREYKLGLLVRVDSETKKPRWCGI